MDKYTNTVPLVFRRIMPMEQLKTWFTWGTISGAGVGLGKFLLQANVPFSEKLIQAMIVAAACGLIGGVTTAAGKWLWNFFKAKFIKSKP